jgi:hypothetical protein
MAPPHDQPQDERTIRNSSSLQELRAGDDFALGINQASADIQIT